MLRNTKQWLDCLELWTSWPGVKYVLKLFSLGFSTHTKQRQLLMYRGRITQPRGFASDEIIDLYTRWVFASCILHCMYIRFIHYLTRVHEMLNWFIWYLFPCDVFQTFPDNFMRREVRALEVHCSFVEEGCSWKGELRFLEVRLIWKILWQSIHYLFILKHGFIKM